MYENGITNVLLINRIKCMVVHREREREREREGERAFHTWVKSVRVKRRKACGRERERVLRKRKVSKEKLR